MFSAADGQDGNGLQLEDVGHSNQFQALSLCLKKKTLKTV